MSVSMKSTVFIGFRRESGSLPPPLRCRFALFVGVCEKRPEKLKKTDSFKES